MFDNNDDDSENWYYDPSNDFQRRTLKHADNADMHPMEYLAHQLDKAFTAMDSFAEQDPKISKADYIAIRWDIAEAKNGIQNACEIIPAQVTELEERE